jgi:hypothetical protein
MTLPLQVVATTERSVPVPIQDPSPVTRDLRLDFIRGWVMLILIVVHSEFFSLWNLVIWERFGVISGGEGFVLLSGVVLGMVSRNRITREGWRAAARKLVDRAFQLYRVQIALIIIVAMLTFVPLVPVHEITTFTDRGTGTVYSMYPAAGTAIIGWIAAILTLKSGPHQVQVLGLYVCVMLAAPLALGMLAAGRTRALLVLSWIGYFANAASTRMPTAAQFEYAFPLLTWQVLFFHGLAVGFHWTQIQEFFRSRMGRLVLVACIVIAGTCSVFAQGTTNPLLPGWARFDLWPPGFYDQIWGAWCQKNTLGLLRLLDYAAFLVVAYALLSRWWNGFERGLGWFFIPMGQATLYVFVLHLFVVAVASAIIPFGFGMPHSLVGATALHTAELMFLWLMVRYKVLYRWIPR